MRWRQRRRNAETSGGGRRRRYGDAGKTVVAHGVIRLYHICLHTAGAIGETSGEWQKVNTDATSRGHHCVASQSISLRHAD